MKVYGIKDYFSPGSLQVAASKVYGPVGGVLRWVDEYGVACCPLGVVLRTEFLDEVEVIEGAPCGSEVALCFVFSSNARKLAIDILAQEFAEDWDDGFIENLEEAFGLVKE